MNSLQKIIWTAIFIVLTAGVSLHAAILVNPAGSAVWTFSISPQSGEWSTYSLPSSGYTISSSSALDSAVQNLNAHVITNALATTGTIPPSVNALARWNSQNHNIQTRPAGVAVTLLMATLKNDSGINVNQLNLRYDCTNENTPYPEIIQGYRVYYSLTGHSNSWIFISELSETTADILQTSLSLPAWQPGAQLYLLWADPNMDGMTDPYRAIDNFFAYIPSLTGIQLDQPAPEEKLSVRKPIYVKAGVTMPGTNVVISYFGNNELLGLASFPFELELTNLPIGHLNIQATAANEYGYSITSSIVSVDIVSNLPPTVHFVYPPAGLYRCAAGAHAYFAITATDPEDTISRIEFLFDGAIAYTDTYPDYGVYWSNIPAGRHSVTAVAYDSLGGRASCTYPFVATNSQTSSILIPNGALWKYHDQGIDLGSAWRNLNYDDSQWKTGKAWFGYGNSNQVCPETTVIRSGLSTTNIFQTAYFRHSFTVNNPSLLSQLDADLFRNDGAVVYLNGVEVFRSNMPTGSVLFGTSALSSVLSAASESYHPYPIAPGLLVPGSNVIAVELHQYGTYASTAAFDFILRAQPPILNRLRISRNVNDTLILQWPSAWSHYTLQHRSHLNTNWDSYPAISSLEDGVFNLKIKVLDAEGYFRMAD